MKESAALPCLIVLDINLPGMTGKDFLALLRASSAFREVPVVLFTTSGSGPDRDFARSPNAGFLTKPMNHRHLPHMVEALLSYCIAEARDKMTG